MPISAQTKMLKNNSLQNMQICWAAVAGRKPLHRYLLVSVAVWSTTAIALFATGVQFVPDRLRAAEAAQLRFDYTGAYRYASNLEIAPKGEDRVFSGTDSEPAVRSAAPLDDRPSAAAAANRRRISYAGAQEGAASHTSDKPLPSAPVVRDRQSTAIAEQSKGRPASGEIVEPAGKSPANIAPASRDRIIVPELSGQLSHGNKSAQPQPQAGLPEFSSGSGIEKDTGTEGVTLSGAQLAKSSQAAEAAQPKLPAERLLAKIPASSQPVVIPPSTQGQARDAAISQTLGQAEPDASQFAERSAKTGVSQKPSEPASPPASQKPILASAAGPAATVHIYPLPAEHPLRAARRREGEDEKLTVKPKQQEILRQENVSPAASDNATQMPDDNTRPAWALSVFQLN